MTAITIRAGSVSYPAFVGSNLLDAAGKIISEHFRADRCAIVTDENVAPLFGDRIIRSLSAAGIEPTLIAVPAGETSKSLEQAGAICERLAAVGLNRSSFILALGGGVVGDVAGFVAAIYHRGIPYVQVPTTLLAMVDSSIGGKTAVNTSAGKNLIGALHQPALVIADVDLLKSLPSREFKQGCAEMIKHALIADAEMFARLEEDGTQLCELRSDESAGSKLATLIQRNLEIKGAIIARDVTDETGERSLLNFGHTIGHAIELASGYGDLRHGEAVSLGLIGACDISVQKAGLPEIQRDAVVALLEKFDLPTHLPPAISRQKILQALRFDKKFTSGQVRLVVISAIGSARVATDVTMEDISEAVRRL